MFSEIEEMACIDLCGRLRRILTSADGRRLERALNSWMRQTARHNSILQVCERLFSELRTSRLRHALRAWNRSMFNMQHRARSSELATFEKTIAALKVEIAQLHFEYKI